MDGSCYQTYWFKFQICCLLASNFLKALCLPFIRRDNKTHSRKLLWDLIKQCLRSALQQWARQGTYTPEGLVHREWMWLRWGGSSRRPTFQLFSSPPGVYSLHSQTPRLICHLKSLRRAGDMSLVLLNGLNWVGSLFPGGFALYLFWLCGIKDFVFCNRRLKPLESFHFYNWNI